MEETSIQAPAEETPAPVEEQALPQEETSAVEETAPQPAPASDPARPTAEAAPAAEDNPALRAHFDSLLAQEAAFRSACPDFSLSQALTDERFLRLTAPGGGLTVEEAWYALHHRELTAAAAEAAAREAGEKLANAVLANRARPTEGGGSREQAIATLNPRSMTPAAREDFHRYVAQALARGEKIYPGQEPAQFRT